MGSGQLDMLPEPEEIISDYLPDSLDSSAVNMVLKKFSVNRKKLKKQGKL